MSDEAGAASGTLRLELPISKPELEIPVIELFLN